MSANLNIFEQLNSDSEGDDFVGITPSNQPPATPFAQTLSSEPTKEKNIFETLDGIEESKKYNFLETARDVGEQVSTKGVAGALGSYGNILDTFGLQAKEQLPGEKAKNEREFEILTKMQSGPPPTIAELSELSDDDQLPRFSRLPTSEDVQKQIESSTGIGEGKTPLGRVSGRAAGFAGEGLTTGGGVKSLLGLAASGAAGQGIREGGGPEALATGVEIGGSLLPSLVTGKVSPIGITKSGKEAKSIVEAGRKIGLSEKQIAPLIQGETKASVLSKVARKGTKTKERFASIKESLGDSYNRIKASPEAKVKIPNAEQLNLRKQFGNIRNELSKTLAPSPDKEAALNYIEKSLETLRNTDITPEYLVNFWQDINKSVKWNSISGGKKALAKLKDPISETLQKLSPTLAGDFEMTNQLYSKYAQISKKLKPDLVDAFVSKGEILAGGAGALALAQGNPWILSGVAGEAALRLLGREMLINPYFQNVATKLVTNVNSGSVKAATETVKQAQDYMKKKHPEEDWSFLTQD